MPSNRICRGFLRGLAVILLLASVAQADRASESQDRRIADLVHQLGDRSYAVRERASKSLIRAGMSAQTALLDALKDPDAEIRFRASQVLSEVLEADFRTRLEAFAADVEGKQQHKLPAWDHFRKLMGEDRIARRLFVEMQSAEPALLEALQSSDRLAGELFAMRCQGLLQALQNNLNVQQQVSLGSVAALLLVGSTKDVNIDEQVAIQMYHFIQQPAFTNGIRAASWSPLLKKLLGLWIVKNNGSSVAIQNLMLAFNYDLKEGLDVSIKMLRNDAGQRQYALLGIGKFGSREHLPLVEPLLKDMTVCAVRRNNLGRETKTQIRDVALGVLVHLSGQQLKAYGFRSGNLDQTILFQPGLMGFDDNAAREIALKKWAAWSEQVKRNRE